ncbi:MAG: type I methionyl aminopeptidase [Acidimicrobiia bacterium]|nr:type I methionyl aminopeptidase [Acidimicrobiia bacterium]
MITLKSEREFEKMTVAGGCVAAVHRAVREAAKPGVSLKELDGIAAAVTADQGCAPSFLDYQPSPHQQPYPGHLCLSVNDVIVHGIPSNYKLRSGDILSVDSGAIFEGFHGDAAFTVGIGEVAVETTKLIEATEEGMWAGIRQVSNGARLGDVGAAVQEVGEAHGYGIVREYVGHGIGRQMHEEPQIPNLGVAGRGMRLRTGMALCIEPMFNMGSWETRVDPDGWTVRTADGSLSAHFEHTVAITREGVRVMTLPGAPNLADVTGREYNSRPVYGTQST